MQTPEHTGPDRHWFCLWNNGKRSGGGYHRRHGPAMEMSDGIKAWFLYDMRHREDGPAYENGNGFSAWWKNGEYISELSSEGLDF